MKWAIDRIENNLAILENIKTKEKKEVELNYLPPNIEEKNIVNISNNIYLLDKEEEILREKLIKDKFDKLKKDNN